MSKTHTSSLPRLARMAAAIIAAAHPEDTALHAALGKARERMTNHEWTVDQGELRIQSDSHRSQYHITDGSRCECEARRWGNVCWHIAAWKILSVLAAACDLETNEQGVLTLVFPADEQAAAVVSR